jgi:23S rRNA pseudouridine1911/1915/1917 synthase
MERQNKPSSAEIQKHTVASEDAAKRLDIFVSEISGITRSQVLKLIKSGNIIVNNRAEDPNYKVREQDIVEVAVHHETGTELTAEDIPLKILFMDEYLAVIDKPAGMVVYPACGHSAGTLMNALAHHAQKLASIGGGLRPGVVHRLDKDTSGVMVVALDDAAYYNLTEQFRDRTISRKYIALVSGPMKEVAGEISLAIGRCDADRKKMSTRTRRGKAALTRWKIIQRLGNATMIEAKLGTGRTHQIRVHFAAIGHSVLGDKTYGKKTHIETATGKMPVPRQMLHAETLGFTHPHTGEFMEFSSPIPDDMKECIERLSSAVNNA